nr:MAG TPA: hypothetical protein [Caudoviricetes sp.]
MPSHFWDIFSYYSRDSILSIHFWDIAFHKWLQNWDNAL